MFKGKRALAFLLSMALVLTLMPVDVQAATVTDERSVKAAAENTNAPGNLGISKVNQGLAITWDSYNDAASYDVYRAESRFGTYTKVATVNATSYTDAAPNADKYANYYKVAVAGSSELSEPISLEIDMFGENMYVFSPKDDVEQVYTAVNDVYKIQGAVDAEGNANSDQQFGDGRYAFAFKTGDYSGMEADQFDMSYYMQLIGLGKVPTDVKIKNVHVPPVLPNWNVTCNFWMGIENLSIAPETVYNSTDVWFDFMWSVSQAAPARRLYVERPTSLNYMWDGWASGGYIADSVFTNKVGSWTQQQYYIRNSKIEGEVYGVNWNMVMQGTSYGSMNDTTHAMKNLTGTDGKTNWEAGGSYTTIASTDIIREKPFLYFDEDQKEYKVFVPGLREKSTGTSWTKNNMGYGVSVDISKFYIARADKDNASTINAALREGKNIILSPGIYYAEEPIQVEKANTIILGLGLATIIPTNEEAAIKVADVGGVSIAGVILDADSYSENMLVVGEEGCNKDHASNPTVLQDVFIRIGGVHGGVASTDQALVINSNDVIGDDFWIWRADHGEGVGWDLNKAKNGVVVNGDDVTLYGLMVEHFQEYDIIWRGENGKTYFLQNEKCYDPQNQADWMSHDGTALGYAAYKVANNVKNHYAVGLGSYDVFINTNGASIFLDNAYEVPDTEGVMIENACIVEIASADGPKVGFNNIINGTGPAISTGVGGGGYARQAVLLYNNNQSLSLDDFYNAGNNDSGITNAETGTPPTDDTAAEKDIQKDAPSVDNNEKNIIDEYENGDGDNQDDYTPNIGDGSVATGPYADWKNNAITYPAKGQLVAAGYIDMKFNQLADAVKYDVYVDNKLVKTFEGDEAKAASYEAEFKNIKVKKHTTYVVATLADGETVTSNIRNFYISKKGMGIWQDDSDKIEELNLSWYYNWSPNELTGVNDRVEFVPMVWGDEADTRSQDRKNEWNWLRNGGWQDYRYLLTFNEPDFTDQSNMTPERAVELWKDIEPIVENEKVDVSSPVVAIPTVFYDTAENDYGTVGGWYGKYDQLMAAAEYHDEFTAVHFYFDYPGEYVLDVLEQIHEKTGKPLWITEWGVGQWTQVQNFDWTGGPDEGNWQRELIVNFMNEIIPQIDQLDYVERYAWFPFDGSNTEKFGNGAGGLFFVSGDNNTEKGALTSVGKAYKEVGNPVGWDPDTVTEDNVVLDGGESSGDKPDPVDPDPIDPDPVGKFNVLAGKTATASSESGDNKAGNAIDGNAGSRWESQQGSTDSEWIQIDLGDTYTVDSFKVVWETAAAKEYKLQVSMDGNQWTDVYEVTDGASGETREDSFTPVAANYIRLTGTSKTTDYGYSIYELEVMGVKGDTTSGDTETPVTGVILNKETLDLKIGVFEKLIATVQPDNATNKEVSWTVDGDAVTVTADGVVTGRKAGTAVVKVTTADGNKTASCTVTVTPEEIPEVAVTGVTLNKTTLELEVEGYEKLAATVVPEKATNKDVTWSSSDSSVVTVTGDGMVYGVKAGTAVVTVTTVDGNQTASCTVTVNPIAVTGVTVNKGEITLEEGMSQQITATVTPANAGNKNVTWSSSDEAVARVDNDGIVTAVKAGDAVITVTTEDGRKTAFSNVTVIERKEDTISVESIRLDAADVTLREGETGTLQAIFTPTEPTNKGVFWKSSDEDIVFVSSEGSMIARKAGEVTVTATTADGGYTATCKVTVLPIEVEGLSLNKNALELEEGISERLVAVVTPSNASNKEITWTSSNPAAATVTADGIVTAVKTGTATITAKCGDKSASLTVTVVERDEQSVVVTGITLNKLLLEVQEGSLDNSLKADVTPADATNKNVIWSSANNDIAIVTADGEVYGRKAGTAVITATTADGGKTASCVVKVTEREAGVIGVTGVELDEYVMNLDQGAEKKLTATVLPEKAANQRVTFKSNDDSVATVTSEGLITAVKAGTAQITVTTVDGGYKAVCVVIVKAPSGKEEDKNTDNSNQNDNGGSQDKIPDNGNQNNNNSNVTVPDNNGGTVEVPVIFNVGTTFADGKLSYKITKAAGTVFEVQVVKPLKKTNTKITIPATVTYQNQIFKVTSIAKNAFKSNTKLKSVTIGANVTSIGNQAFYGCKKMTSVTIGKNVKTIGSKAFYNCTKLAKVTFKGANVTKIGSKAFVKTSKKIKFKVGKNNIKKYTKLLKKKAPATAKITK